MKEKHHGFGFMIDLDSNPVTFTSCVYLEQLTQPLCFLLLLYK